MNVRYEHKQAMILIGFSTMIRPDEGYVKCPEFWDKEYTQKYARLCRTLCTEICRMYLSSGFAVP